MAVNNYLKDLFSGLVHSWKAYEETEYKSHHETGDKLLLDDSKEYQILEEYMKNTVLTIRAELELIFLTADSHFNSVISSHVYKPLWEVYKHPITYKMTVKQCEHLVKTLNRLLSVIYTYKCRLDLYDIVSTLSIKSEGYRTFAETDIGTIIAKKHLMTPPTDFGNGGFGPVGKALPGSLARIINGNNKELSPHTEVLIENIKDTLENTQYGILKPEESEEEKNYKGNKDIIKNKDHFKGYFKKIGISMRGF